MGFGKDGKGAIIRESQSVTLGALARLAGVSLVGPAITEDFRLLKSVIHATCESITAGEGAGMSLYISNGELSTAERELAIETTGPLDRNDRLLMEQAERFVKLIGVVDTVAGADGIITFRDPVTNGPVLTPATRWTFNNPEGWDFLFYNTGPALTTGGAGVVIGQHFGVWVT